MKPDPPLPIEPTDLPAGSIEKIKLMRRRQEQRRRIHHPADSRVKVEQRRDPEPPPRW